MTTKQSSCNGAPAPRAIILKRSRVIMSRESPEGYIRESTERIAAPLTKERVGTESAFIFRAFTEWFALPTAVCERVIDQCPVHSVPHRRNGVLLGIGTVFGDLLPVVSLARLFDLPATGDSVGTRVVVFASNAARFVIPVSEVFGVQRFHPEDLVPPPSTLLATAAYTRGLLAWDGHMVGCLDPERLATGLKRSIA